MYLFTSPLNNIVDLNHLQQPKVYESYFRGSFQSNIEDNPFATAKDVDKNPRSRNTDLLPRDSSVS